VIKEVKVKSGDKVKVGAVVLTVDDGAKEPAAKAGGDEAAPKQAPAMAPAPLARPEAPRRVASSGAPAPREPVLAGAGADLDEWKEF